MLNVQKWLRYRSLVIVAGFFSYVMADGCMYSFNVLYPEITAHFATSHAKTSLLIAMIYSLMGLCCFAVISPAQQAFGLRPVMFIGSVFVLAGFSSFYLTTNLLPLFFTAGILLPIGIQVLYQTPPLCLATHFKKSRGGATAIVVSGGGLGAFILTPLCQYFIELYSWRGACLVMGAIYFNSAVCACFFCQGTRHEPAGAITRDDNQEMLHVDAQVITDGNKVPRSRYYLKAKRTSRMYLSPEFRTCHFILYILSNIVFCFWITFPQTYMADAARHQGQTPMQAAFLPATIGVASIVGNLAAGFLSMKLPSLVIDGVCIGLLGSSLFVLQSVLHDFFSSVVVCAFYGLFYGSRYALIFENLIFLIDVKNVKAGLGFYQLSAFIAMLPGTPIGGIIFDKLGSYILAFQISGAMFMGSAILRILSWHAARISKRRDAEIMF